MFGTEIRRGQEAQQRVGEIAVGRARAVERRFDIFEVCGPLHRPLIHRRLGRNRLDRNGRHFVAVPEDAHESVAGHFAHHGRVEVPLLEHAHHVVFAAALGHDQHALLRFAEHDLVRRHAALAHRHAIEDEAHARAGAACHLE